MGIRLNQLLDEAHMCMSHDGISIDGVDTGLVEIALGSLILRRYTVVICPVEDICQKECANFYRKAVSVTSIRTLNKQRYVFEWGTENKLEFTSLDQLQRGSFRGMKIDAIIYYKV